MEKRNVVALAALVLVSSASLFASNPVSGAINTGVDYAGKPMQNRYVAAVGTGLSLYAAYNLAPLAYKWATRKFPVTQANRDANAAREQAAADAIKKANRKTAGAALSDGPKKNNEYVNLVAAENDAKKAREAKLAELVSKDPSLVTPPAPAQKSSDLV